MPKQDELNQQKKKDYEVFTIASLGPVYKPNSKARVAREAINEFGLEKYGHSSYEAVAKRYIKEPFEKYGETNNQSVWVWFYNYEPLPKEIEEEWRNILKEEKISEQEAANAFYRQEQGQDISKEKESYKTATQRFKAKYGQIAVLVSEWKCKAESN